MFLALQVWGWILIIVAAAIVAFVAGFFIARAIMQRYLKKNPPITEKMVRAMMMQMGRKPSERQVRQIMAQIEQENK